jgi:phosphatidate cytidylyltransferase
MIKRIITAVIGILVLIAILVLPEIAFHIAAGLVIAGILYEVLRAMKVSLTLWCVSAISAILSLLGIMTSHFAPCLIASIMLYMITAIILHGKQDIKVVLSTGFLTWFVTLFMSAIMLLYHHYEIYGVLLVFICAWGTDTFAYFTGLFFGKHKLIPHVSPKKTVEGAVGGAVGSMILCLVYARILALLTVYQGDIRFYIMFAVLGLAASMLAQIGDLAASALKRDCEIKDFGTIFPGHGGIMDRFDSVVFIAPFIYYFITYLSVLV